MHWIARASKLANARRTVHARAGDPPTERGVFAKQKDNRGQLYIYDFIGDSFLWGSGVTAKSVNAELAKLKDVSALDIYINSEGGSVTDGKAIYNLLNRFKAKKTVYIDGLAASAASFIAMVGDRIVMAENATMMMHEAFGVYGGNAAVFFNALQDLDRENALIAGMYAARSGRPAAEFWNRAPLSGAQLPDSTGLMAEETWFTAAQAVEMKLCDEIEANAAGDDGEEADDSLAAKVPALRIAVETQRRISAARVRLVDTEHSVLQDRRRASPGRSTQRPAAPDPKRNSPPSRSA